MVAAAPVTWVVLSITGAEVTTVSSTGLAARLKETVEILDFSLVKISYDSSQDVFKYNGKKCKSQDGWREKERKSHL